MKRTIEPYFEFVKAAVSNPLQISTLFQTSPWLRDRLLEGLPLETSLRVCELGPGAGAITGGLSRRLGPNTAYVGIELNSPLVYYLHKSYPHLHFVEGSAELCEELADKGGQFDVVVSSLPWTIFDSELQKTIMSAVVKSLRPGGMFCTYVCLNASWYPSARSLKELINKHFSVVKKSDIEWRNIPPAFVYYCTK